MIIKSIAAVVYELMDFMAAAINTFSLIWWDPWQDYWQVLDTSTKRFCQIEMFGFQWAQVTLCISFCQLINIRDLYLISIDWKTKEFNFSYLLRLTKFNSQFTSSYWIQGNQYFSRIINVMLCLKSTGNIINIYCQP